MKEKSYIGRRTFLGTGMAAAAHLVKRGFEVDIYENNDLPGGRSKQFKADSFTFDVGPIWISFPEIFQQFFKEIIGEDLLLSKEVEIEPIYRIYLTNGECIDLSSNLEKNKELFKRNQRNGAIKLKRYIDSGQNKYTKLLKAITADKADRIFHPGFLFPLSFR